MTAAPVVELAPIAAVPSVRKRFAFTVAANLLRSALSFLTGLLLARWLGPNAFGDMAFLLGTFAGLRQLLDMGTSTAFFTFLSQRPRSIRFVRTYYAWLALQFILPLAAMALVFPDPWVTAIWRGQPRGLVLVAFAAAFMQNSAWPVLQHAAESQRKTVQVQGIGVVVVAIHLIAVALLWLTGTLGVFAVLAAVAIEYVLACVIVQRQLTFSTKSDDASDDGVRAQFRKYFVYCLPMIPYAAAGFAQEFADRWLLQTYGGGVQQAYYAIGAQFAAIALLATSSILRIFWKEVAEAHHRGDHARAHGLYKRVSRLLFLVGAVAAGFFLPWSAVLLRRLLGPAYVGGAATLAIMFLYPVHQSMGQIGTTALLATERVKLQSIIGIVTMVASVMVSYFVLAPPSAAIPGLGLASQGLAIKMVAVQLVAVNVMAFMVARVWRQRFDWVYQPVSLLGCLAMGWLAHAAASIAFGPSSPLVLPMALAATIYAGLVAGFVYALPWTAGVTRTELVDDVRRGLAVAGIGSRRT